MAGRLIVVGDPERLPTLAIRDAITTAEGGCGWWHHYVGAWLIADPLERPAAWWRDRLRAAGAQHFVVLEGVPGRWASFGPAGVKSWLEGTWSQ